MRLKALGALALFLLITLPSCTWQNVEDLDLNANCPTDSVSFSAHILPILTTNCANPDFGDCHQAGTQQPAYTDYTGVLPVVQSGALNNRAVLQKNMPPSFSNGPTSLSQCDISLIDAWLQAGAPDN